MLEWPALSSRSLYSSHDSTSSVKTAPTRSQSGRPFAKRSSMTHWRNGSATTGHRSTIPCSRASHARSPSVVLGVIRSTIELGNVHAASIHSASAPSRRCAAASVAHARDGAVAGQVVAAEDRERRVPRVAPAFQRGGDEVERRVRSIGIRAIGDRVAGLRDRERHDRDLRVGEDLDRRIGPAGREGVVDDGADDARFRSVVLPFDQRVQPVLGRERVPHRRVTGEHADAADPPVTAGHGQLVRVHGEVGPVETADPDVHDARDAGADRS